MAGAVVGCSDSEGTTGWNLRLAVSTGTKLSAEPVAVARSTTSSALAQLRDKEGVEEVHARPVAGFPPPRVPFLRQQSRRLDSCIDALPDKKLQSTSILLAETDFHF